MRKTIRKLLFLFIILSVVWPFYIDIRLSTTVGINPQRLILIILFLFEAIGGRFKGLNKLNKMWLFVFSLYIFYRLFVGIYYKSSLSIVLSANEILTLYLLSILCAKYLTFADIYRIGRIFYFTAFYLLAIVVLEFVTKRNVFAGINSGIGKAAQGAAITLVREGFDRVKGTFENSLTLMQYLLFSYPLIHLYIKRVASGKRFKNIAVTFAYAIMMAMTLSRFGIALFALEILVIVFFSFRSRLVRVSMVTIGILSIVPFYLVLSSSVFDEKIQLGTGNAGTLLSSDQRVAQLVAAGAVFVKHPFIGFGLGSAGDTLYEESQQNNTSYVIYDNSVDDRFVSILVESGIFPCILFFLIFVMSIRKSFMFVRSTEQKMISMIILVIFASLFILSIFTLYPLIFILLSLVNKRRNIRVQETLYLDNLTH